MRLIPVQYLRPGDVIDSGSSYLQEVTEWPTRNKEHVDLVGIAFGKDGEWFEQDRLMNVVGHELEIWDDLAREEPVLLQQEWSVVHRKYVAEHAFTGQAD